MLLADHEIKERAIAGMITPFVDRQIRAVEVEGNGMSAYRKVLSYGLGSYGYDIRLSPKDFRVFRHIPGTVVNPKRFNQANLESVSLRSDEDGDYFVLPAHSYGLGVAIECLDVPSDITILCVGKSSYARAGVIANTTPAESKWRGHLTLEFSNSSGADCRIYANEGVVQLLFLQGAPCRTSYADRTGGGKYQDQSEEVTVARV